MEEHLIVTCQSKDFLSIFLPYESYGMEIYIWLFFIAGKNIETRN